MTYNREMPTKVRYFHIDLLRASATIGFIAVHVLSYNLNSSLNLLVWNILQFVVITFVLLSGYILTARYKEIIFNWNTILGFYRKRIANLLVPFYFYLLFHYLLWYSFPNFFSGIGLIKSLPFIVSSSLLTGGVKVNWLPLLFIQLYLLFPLFMRFWNNKKILMSYVLLGSFVTVFFTLYKIPESYFRFTMWLPWSLIFLTGILIKTWENKQEGVYFLRYIGSIFISITMFILLLLFLSNSHRSLNFIDNKYPPNFYYLSYGLGLSLLAYLVSLNIVSKLDYLKSIYLYISKKSYPLFFIHFIILDFILRINLLYKLQLSPIIEFIIISLSSILICIILDRLTMIYSSKKIKKVEV